MTVLVWDTQNFQHNERCSRFYEFGACSTRELMVSGEKGRQLILSKRRAEQEALDFIAAEITQSPILLHVLDALGDDRESQPLSHDDNGFDDDGILAAVHHAGDERAINFDRVDGQLRRLLNVA